MFISFSFVHKNNFLCTLTLSVPSFVGGPWGKGRGGGGGEKLPAAHNSQTMEHIQMKLGGLAGNDKLIN